MPKFIVIFYRNLIIISALILASYFSWTKSTLADPTQPGTIIDNTATGSFIGEGSGITNTVTSNTVKMTVLEVAGITAQSTSVTEAPIGVTNAGTYQGIAGINTGDVVYFDFTLTNVGNDPTAFFIPIPDNAHITGGTLQSVQIIAVDPDGAGAVASKTLAVNVLTENDTVALLGATDGYIPVNGTVTVRVAVKVTQATVGQPITVILGDTDVNDNGSATQNQPYTASNPLNSNLDVYTVDLANNTANPYPLATYPSVSQVAEANGNPANGDAIYHRQEASAKGSIDLVATPIIQTPLVCDGRFYQIRATANNSKLYLINRFTNPYSDILQSSTADGTVLNGLAYNPSDNYMYALLRGPDSGNTSGVTATNALYRLDNSTIVSLGGITGLPNGFAPTAADFGPDGSYYVTRAGGSTELYKINIATQTATLITMSQDTGNIGDMAYNPVDGQLYGVGGSGNITLFKINPVTGVVTTATITGTSITPETWGTTFFDPIGTFYAYANDGRFYRIDKVTGVATLLSSTPPASVSDGAVCQFTAEKIDVVKSAGSVTRVNATTFDIPYTIQVKNTAAFNAPNVQITENFNLDSTFTAGSPTISIQVAPAVTSGTALTINPSFTGLTSTTYNLLSGLNSLAGGASATITFTVRLVYASAGVVPPAALNNQVYASTITSTTAPGTPNPGFTFPSNIPVPPPDLITADTSTNSNALPASANADTPSPTPVTLPTASNPNLLLVKRLTAVNNVPITTSDNTEINAADKWPTPATYLRGEISRNGVKPGDRLEYTIYFLSAGDTDITDVTICDLIPPNTTFISNAYDVVGGGGNLGIGFANSTTVIPTSPTSYLTSVFDTDSGKFYPAGSLPPTTCKKPHPTDPTQNSPLTAADNTDGIVIVDVVKSPVRLPFATASGLPTNSYGFVRFQVTVK